MSKDRGHGTTCHWCARRLVGAPSRSALMATRDHVYPKSKGGWETVWACFTCNTLKGNMLPAAWATFMAENPTWWVNGPKPFKKMRRAYAWPGSDRPPVRYHADAEAVRALARQIIAEW